MDLAGAPAADSGLWPFPAKSPDELRTSGFSDDEVAQLLELRPPDYPRSQWMFWSSELYCLGKCFRSWIGWPERLPLPFESDHGVAISGVLARRERESPARLHLVWGDERERLSRTLTSKTVVRVPHPWIPYRLGTRPLPSPDRRGTVAFYPHTTAHVSFSFDYHARYLEQLRRLGPTFQPVVVMLHMHDVRSELVREIRGAGFPVLTAGHTSSYRFVDRFYELIDAFEHATSPTVGSQLFYCHEFGLNYFLHGDVPEYVNRGDPNLSQGPRRPVDVIEHKNFALAHELFGSPARLDLADRDDFVIRLLGLDSQPDRARLKALLVAESVRLWNHDGQGVSRLRALGRSLLKGAD